MADDIIGYIDIFSLSTLNEETEEICCPSCGSWSSVHDLMPDEDGFFHCPLCM